MIVFRASRRNNRAVVAVCCSIALVVGAAAHAQGVAPAQLGPTPLHQARKPAVGEPPPAIERPAGDVRVEQLGNVSREVIGLTDADQGRFGLDLWRGTRREVVEALLPHLPSRIRSPAMLSLARRLLLTAAEPPAGEAGETPLIALRIERLIAMGAIDEAQELLARTPASDDQRLAQASARLHLLRSDPGSACDIMRNARASYIASFWQRVLIACQALAGQQNEALFGLSLLREQNDTLDSTFEALIEIITGADAAPPQPIRLTALNFALLQAAGYPITEGFGDVSDPALARAIAAGESSTADARLQSAHDAAAMGALDPQALRKLYAAIDFSADERANPLSAATAIGGPRGLALLYREAEAQAIPAARAEVLRHLIVLARAQGDAVLAARLVAPLITPAAQAAELAWFAPLAARVLLAAGDAPQALEWYRTLNPSLGGQAASDQAELWPLLRVALGDGGRGLGQLAAGNAGPAVVSINRGVRWEKRSLANWRAAQDARAPETAGGRAASLLSVFTALDEPLSEADWLAMADAEPRPEAASLPTADLWFGLARAANQNRVGESVLRALLVLGDDGPAGVHPIVLYRVVASLTQVGLQPQARALALEALLAAGL